MERSTILLYGVCLLLCLFDWKLYNNKGVLVIQKAGWLSNRCNKPNIVISLGLK
jgi:hypothetical protein